MLTTIIRMDEPEDERIEEAAEIIRNGGLVAFPTETVYGLGANGLNADAAMKIYSAKGRPSDNPLIIHISNLDMLEDLVKEVPKVAKKLIEEFWPGPMTLIFKKSDIVPSQTTGGLDTVAVRFPKHPIAQALIEKAGVGIAAPSANLSGRPSPTCGYHVIEDMNGRIDMIIDGGKIEMGLESTIIDVTGEVPTILRPGFITQEMLEDILDEVKTDGGLLKKPDKDFRPKAPGMKYRHYAPKAEFIMFRGESKKVEERILSEVQKNLGKKIGIMTVDEHMNYFENLEDVELISLGSISDEKKIASNIFDALRRFDSMDVEIIFGEAFSQENIGFAIMNRLTKAAGYNIIDV